MASAADLDRIREALERAGKILMAHSARGVTARMKKGDDPVTEADLETDAALKAILPQPGDGWLSEETADDASRLDCSRVWVVDPLDGTREFVQGIPEWCCSIGLVEDGLPTAGGIYNPATDQMIVGAIGFGVTLNGKPSPISSAETLEGALVLGSRSEEKRGEWDAFKNGPIKFVATGSVAFKFGQVAAGLCDATWTLVPKSEWDVAAGVALVRAAGGDVVLSDWEPPLFNKPTPKFPGLVAANTKLLGVIRTYLGK